MKRSRTLFLLSSGASTLSAAGGFSLVGPVADTTVRPLLQKFGRGIQRRIRNSEEGSNRHGQAGAYTSEEILTCLDMLGTDTFNAHDVDISSRRAIRRAFTESTRIQDEPHGRSSGSGCTIIRLTGADADSIRGLTQYADRFFERVDNEDCSDDVKDTGMFRVDDMVYAGYDEDVNGEGKMQFLDTRLLPNMQGIDPLMLPMEVGELVGSKSLDAAHDGMNTLLDIGTQITSAVLDMDTKSADKLIDDGTHVQQGCSDSTQQPNSELMAGDVSNSYHRLIRYLQPQPSSTAAAFKPHVDSTFLTLIPMPELPGLEVWCPSSSASDESSDPRGEWVRPMIPFDVSLEQDPASDCAYVIAMTGEFLQLTSNGDVPTCIHRVIPPQHAKKNATYKPRVSAPMFLRPRRGAGACLDVGRDLTLVDQPTLSESEPQQSIAVGEESALYFEKGLLEECDLMHLWSAHDIMKRK
ncbi:hypothetical protein ACHAXT_009984 [Thalassiosira profunda]